jgi:hypothetical protein
MWKIEGNGGESILNARSIMKIIKIREKMYRKKFSKFQRKILNLRKEVLPPIYHFGH